MDEKAIKRNESFFSGDLLRLILRQTIFCSAAVLAGYYIGAFINTPSSLIPSADIGQTMSFLICGWTSIMHIFHVRSSKSVFKTPIKNNKPLASSAMIMMLVFGLLVALPVRKLFGLSSIDGIHWLIVIGLSIIPAISRELGRLIDTIPAIAEGRHLKKEYISQRIQSKR